MLYVGDKIFQFPAYEQHYLLMFGRALYQCTKRAQSALKRNGNRVAQYVLISSYNVDLDCLVSTSALDY